MISEGNSEVKLYNVYKKAMKVASDCIYKPRQRYTVCTMNPKKKMYNVSLALDISTDGWNIDI